MFLTLYQTTNFRLFQTENLQMTISSLTKNGKKLSKWVENIEERRNCSLRANFSFSYSVFKRLVLQTHKNQGLFRKGLIIYNQTINFYQTTHTNTTLTLHKNIQTIIEMQKRTQKSFINKSFISCKFLVTMITIPCVQSFLILYQTTKFWM